MSRLNFTSILWDRDDDPQGNVQHIAKHNVTMQEVEDVFQNPAATDTSRTSGLPAVFGDTRAGRHMIVVYKVIDASTVRPITAYDVPRRK
jgi:uncharacterized DUF497 family protein